MIKEDKSNNKIEQYLESQCPSIALAKKHIGEEKIKTELTAHFVAFIDYVGVKNSFTLNHIDQLVDDLISKFYNLKVSEVMFVLKKARLGEYGEMYNNINPIKIMTWFDSYFNERLDVAEKRSMNQWSSQKSQEIKEKTPLLSEGQRLGNVSKIINDIQ